MNAQRVWLLIDNGPVGEIAKVDQSPIGACESESDAQAIGAWRLAVENRLTLIHPIWVIAER